MFSKSISKHKVPLEYLYDSEMQTRDSSVTLAIKVVDCHVLDSLATVTEIKSKVYNYAETNMSVRLGKCLWNKVISISYGIRLPLRAKGRAAIRYELCV